MRRREAGFSVLEILIIGGIVAIIAAIAIVNYMNATNRARQKRTMNDMRVIAQAWEQRAAETHSYQVAGYTFPAAIIPYDSLAGALRPTYIRDFPAVDGWKRPWQFGFEPGTGATPGSYAIRSAGRDGGFEATYTPGVTTDPDADIVWSDGQFVRYPETFQTN